MYFSYHFFGFGFSSAFLAAALGGFTLSASSVGNKFASGNGEVFPNSGLVLGAGFGVTSEDGGTKPWGVVNSLECRGRTDGLASAFGVSAAPGGGEIGFELSLLSFVESGGSIGLSGSLPATGFETPGASGGLYGGPDCCLFFFGELGEFGRSLVRWQNRPLKVVGANGVGEGKRANTSESPVSFHHRTLRQFRQIGAFNRANPAGRNKKSEVDSGEFSENCEDSQGGLAASCRDSGASWQRPSHDKTLRDDIDDGCDPMNPR